MIFPGGFGALSWSDKPAKLRAVKAIPGTLQEGGATFESTHWSVVLLAAQSLSPEATQAALTEFCQSYWPPLYTFIRRRGYPPNDAQDLVQGFFVHLFEANTLSHASREKGRLRAFLLGSLQYFLTNEHDRGRVLKRGGGQQIVSLDAHFREAEAAVHAAAGVEATTCYDRAWAATLLERCWEHLRTEIVGEGREAWLNEVKPLVFGGTAALTDQEQVAARLSVPPTTLRTSLHRLRQRFREKLRQEIARTVSAPEEIDEEMRYLHRVLRS